MVSVRYQAQFFEEHKYITKKRLHMQLYTNRYETGYTNGAFLILEGVMFTVEKEFLHPNIGVTIRFTPILYSWLKSVSKRENISFNQLVLQCCKNCMEMDLEDEAAEGQKKGTMSHEGNPEDRNL